MSRVTVRVTHADGCVMEIRMSSRDYQHLHERWLDLALGDGAGFIPLPTPSGDIVDVPATEIASLEPLG
ncbi:MAG: hypothetical protein ABFS86_14390 [Planctomycetota bacterium]